MGEDYRRWVDFGLVTPALRLFASRLHQGTVVRATAQRANVIWVLIHVSTSEDISWRAMDTTVKGGIHPRPAVIVVDIALASKRRMTVMPTVTVESYSSMSITVEVCLFLGNQHSIESFLKQADGEMYQAKRLGKCRLIWR